MSDDALPLCACEQYYDSHHPECPARRAYEALASRLEVCEAKRSVLADERDRLVVIAHDSINERDELRSRLGAVEDELRHSVSVMSIVRSWLLENVRGSTHWENCEREHATCRAISQLGGVVERLSRLNLTAAGRESLQNVPQIGPGRIPQT